MEFQHFCHHITGEVVIGWPQPSGEDQEIHALEREPDERRQITATVSDDAFRPKRDAEIGQSLGEEERVRIHACGSEELASYRDDLSRLKRFRRGPHANSVGNKYTVRRSERFA